MEKFGAGRRWNHIDEPEDRIEIDRGEWDWVKEHGSWKPKLLPPIERSWTPEGHKEQERRTEIFLDLLDDLREISERSKNHGFLRDHPRYKELLIKWAMRHLRTRGFNVGKYSGSISDRGYLLDNEGLETSEKLTYLVRNAREWIDEKIEFELQLSEGFVDITHDYEKREKEELYPRNEGWYNEDQG